MDIKILFIGDVFGTPGILELERRLPSLLADYEIDFVIAQAENVSGRKGFTPRDYARLQRAGVNAFTLGNHYLAKPEVQRILGCADVISPANLPTYSNSAGSRVFSVKNYTIRVTSLLGIAFNSLQLPWKQTVADNFFDTIDNILVNIDPHSEDFHIVDFHAETTSEKSVLGLYLDGRVDAVLGTHTHVQTNDARILPKGTFYITDVGMTGPSNCAIGVNYNEVYEKMRYNSRQRFRVSDNPTQFNGVIITLSPDKRHTFKVLNIYSTTY